MDIDAMVEALVDRRIDEVFGNNEEEQDHDHGDFCFCRECKSHIGEEDDR